MPNRSFSASGYRYGFNGQEKDDEINVGGGSYDFGARIYDSRLGRWVSQDPVTQPYQSPYCGLNNSPIYLLDPNGEKVGAEIDKKQQGKNATGLSEKQQLEALETTKSELEKTTGLKLNLVKTTEKNKDIYNFEIDKSSKPEGGSKAARKLLTKMIKSDDQVTLLFNDKYATSTDIDGGVINLNPLQIVDNALSANGVSPMAASFGISALHEFLHIKHGGHSARTDKFGNIDKIIRKENVMRKQLGPSFGIRVSYMGMSVNINERGTEAEKEGNTDQYLPMSNETLENLSKPPQEPGNAPYFIRHGKNPNYQTQIDKYGGIK
jgi:RHS repeat-associated protein